VWVYDVFNSNGQQLAIVVVDLSARPTRRGGVWLNAHVRQKPLEDTSPVVAKHLNLPKPLPGPCAA
jgi:peptidyl-dipeptidase Dcp